MTNGYGKLDGTKNANKIPVIIALPSKCDFSFFFYLFNKISVARQLSTETTVINKALIPKK